jgi:hypothetical protein
MVKLQIVVDDATYQALQDRAEIKQLALDLSVAQELRIAVALLPASERCVVVTGAVLTTLETILGAGSLLNEADLLAKVENLAGVSFEHCRLTFSPGQLRMLQEKADRQGLSVQQLVERTAPRMYEQFFDLVARV